MKCLSYTVSVIALVLSVLLGAAMAEVTQSPTLRGAPLTQYEVIEVKLKERIQHVCQNQEQPVYSENDFNQNGVLDEMCIGVRYDPCDIHKLQIAIIRFAMSGNGCKSRADVTRIADRIAICADGFSPRPDYCQ